MKKVLFTATIDGHIKAFHLPYLKWFKEQGWETYVASNSQDKQHADGQDLGADMIPCCDHKYNIAIQRSPFDRRNFKAYKQLKSILGENRFDLIHCHTPMGGVLTRLVADKYRKQGTRVLYTAHGFHFFKGGPKSGWLIYYPVEKMLAHKTDVLITINHEDLDRAKRKFKACAIEYVPGVGIDTGRFALSEDAKGKARNRIRKEFGIPDGGCMLLSVGELNRNKNHEAIIRALGQLHNDDLYYVICGDGDLKEHLGNIAYEVDVSEHLFMAGQRDDVIDFYNAADIYCHPSLREGLPVALMEAMASGLPVICSKIRGNTDLIEDGKEGYLVITGEYYTYKQPLTMLASDNTLRIKTGIAGTEKIQSFDLSEVANKMKSIYIL